MGTRRKNAVVAAVAVACALLVLGMVRPASEPRATETPPARPDGQEERPVRRVVLPAAPQESVSDD